MPTIVVPTEVTTDDVTDFSDPPTSITMDATTDVVGGVPNGTTGGLEPPTILTTSAVTNQPVPDDGLSKEGGREGGRAGMHAVGSCLCSERDKLL